MDAVWGFLALSGHLVEAVLAYIETHHWIFGFLIAGYLFYLHDRAVHARFDELEKQVQEIRRRLALEY